MPHRIQRKRTKGWKMPPNTVYVGRPSKWGNPYTYKDFEDGSKSIDNVYKAACMYGVYLAMDAEYLLEDAVQELRGKNLACWCPLKTKEGYVYPCHADVLLYEANEANDILKE